MLTTQVDAYFTCFFGGKPEMPAKSSNAEWSELAAANDTNRYIIYKFLRKGFQSLSAEELACTMVQPEFSTDFEQATGEKWHQSYQFKVLERLNKCNFNMKWKTKGSASSQAGTSEEDTFFQLCKVGDMNRLLLFLQS